MKPRLPGAGLRQAFGPEDDEPTKVACPPCQGSGRSMLLFSNGQYKLDDCGLCNGTGFVLPKTASDYRMKTLVTGKR